jgi:hypothetical protein
VHDPADDLGNALYQARMIRFGLEAAWQAIDTLPGTMAPTPHVRTALRTIADWLEHTEAGQLRDLLTTRTHAILLPVSLLNPPAPDDMKAITTAIAVLNTHGLVITDRG